MYKSGNFLLLLLGLSLFSFSVAEKAWWETASFYQIYPRSFKDSDGDGIGDLRGVTESLEYLKEIGVTGTWLSPFLKSPMADFGYDIADFYDVDPIFGDMNDFEEMIERAKELDIRIILDFVPNHSSDECEWFIKSVARDPEYEDFYVWHPGKIINGVRHPPTNWMSVFRGSGWEWNDERQEYYLHQFHRKQPDFNYRNPKVHEALNDVLRFWLNKGVDGFRIDATDWAFEIAPDANGNWPDESRNYYNSDPGDYYYLEHSYTFNQPETKELVYEWRSVLDEFRQQNGGDERILMVETWSSVQSVMEYYGKGNVEGGQIPFNFQMLMYINEWSDAWAYSYHINNWLQNMPAGRTANWVLGNHDKNRIGSRLGEDRIDIINALLLTLPGCSITYNGEEIGMTDGWVSWEETVDPQACNGAEDGYEYRSRDPARTPFQWNDQKNAGFSSGSSTWLPIADNYESVNVANERASPLSHLNIYKQLQALRSEETFLEGEGEVEALNKHVLGIQRYLSGEYTYVILLNLFDDIENVNLNSVFNDLTDDLEYVLITDKSIKRKGDIVSSKSVTLMPKEAIVLKTTAKLR